MELSVKGIKFTEDELLERSVSDFVVGEITKSHIVHVFKGHQCMLLLRAGELLTKDFIEKYQNKNIISLKTLPIASVDAIDKYTNVWMKLKAARSEKEQIKLRDELLLNFLTLNHQNSKNSILDFVISCFDQFYHLPKEVIETFQEKSHLMLTRAMLMSSFSTLSCIAYGICDYQFIKDFYNATLFLDFGLVNFKEFNYMLSKACEQERLKPGTGLSYLKEHKRSESEQEAFLKHPNQSVEFLKKYEKYFLNKEIIELIRFHHEKSDGSGFPGGIYYSALGQSEMLMAFCDNLIPFEEHLYSKNDGFSFVSMYFENLTKLMNDSNIPVSGVVEAWRGVMSWNKKNEVAG